MDLLDYRFILAESDASVRELERRVKAGDYTVIGPLASAYQRIGNIHGLLRILPQLSEADLQDLGMIDSEILRLKRMAEASKGLIDQIDVLDGLEVTKHIISNAAKIGLSKPSVDSRATTMNVLEPYLPLLAQDARTAYGSAVAFKFVWEEVEDRQMATLALEEMSKDTQIALKYFAHFSNVVNQRDRRLWPWRFGDPLGEDVLGRIAGNPQMAIQFARIASKTDPSKEPWPNNTTTGFIALSVLIRHPKLFDEYLNLPQGSRALNNSKIRAMFERTQSQNYW